MIVGTTGNFELLEPPQFDKLMNYFLLFLILEWQSRKTKASTLLLKVKVLAPSESHYTSMLH